MLRGVGGATVNVPLTGVTTNVQVRRTPGPGSGQIV